jgi:hypothetical protein
VIAPICAVALFMGIVPGVFLKPIEPAVRRTLSEIVVSSSPLNAARLPAAAPHAAATAAAPASTSGVTPALSAAPAALEIAR